LRALDNLLLGFVHLTRINVPVQAGNFCHSIFCAPFFLQQGYAIVDTHAGLVVLAHKGLRPGAPIFRIFIEELNAVPARVGNCSNASEHDDPRLLRLVPNVEHRSQAVSAADLFFWFES
jgi:hypothetical protein